MTNFFDAKGIKSLDARDGHSQQIIDKRLKSNYYDSSVEMITYMRAFMAETMASCPLHTRGASRTIGDFCAGRGALGITASHAMPTERVTFFDTDPDLLNDAMGLAKKHGNQETTFCSKQLDLLDPNRVAKFDTMFDVTITNPPTLTNTLDILYYLTFMPIKDLKIKGLHYAWVPKSRAMNIQQLGFILGLDVIRTSEDDEEASKYSFEVDGNPTRK